MTIGEFKEIYDNPTLPSIMDAVGKIDSAVKPAVIEHLKRGTCIAIAVGFATDVISGEIITQPRLDFRSDGTFDWRSDVLYYVEHYDIALPEEFIQFVQNQN